MGVRKYLDLIAIQIRRFCVNIRIATNNRGVFVNKRSWLVITIQFRVLCEMSWIPRPRRRRPPPPWPAPRSRHALGCCGRDLMPRRLWETGRLEAHTWLHRRRRLLRRIPRRNPDGPPPPGMPPQRRKVPRMFHGGRLTSSNTRTTQDNRKSDQIGVATITVNVSNPWSSSSAQPLISNQTQQHQAVP